MEQKNDSENEGITGNVIENKRPELRRFGRTWNVYEK
jgi:hypothetical protein